MAAIPLLTLTNGQRIPAIAYGTGSAWYKPGPGGLDRSLIEAVKTAIGLGYRHLDGAEVYGTEPEIGLAIEESGVPRSEFFVTTKVRKGVNNIPKAFEESLKNLKLEYLDLYLIHEPFFANSPAELQSAWAAMEALQVSGRVRSIGVSNCLPSHLCTILETAKIPPAVNQVEFHPYLDQTELLVLAKKHGIVLEAYSPLTPLTYAAGGPLDAVVKRIAAKYGVSDSAVLLRWVLDQGLVAVTTSGNERRLKGYLEGTQGWQLSKEDVEEIGTEGKKSPFRYWFVEEIKEAQQ